jgi:Zn-dependent protease
MRSAISLGRAAGIDVRIHWTFLLLLVWVGWQHLSLGHGASAALVGVAFIVAVFGCVVLHELGHALTARTFGVGTRDITLYPIGGVATLDRIPDEPRQELLVALAGPAVNVAIAIGLALVLGLGNGLDSVEATPSVGAGLVANLLLVNIALGVFNLIPAFPMDGGRVLRALLAMRMDRVRATRVAASVGQGLAILFGVAGLFFNWFLLFIALFVYMGAEQEARAVEAKGAMQGATVADAMVRRVRTLHADAPLKEAMEELLAGEQIDFPVVDSEGRYVGMLYRDALIRGLAAGRLDEPIRTLAISGVTAAAPDAPLSDVVDQLGVSGGNGVPVVVEGTVVGLLTVQNVGEWMAVDKALASVRATTAAPDSSHW